MNIKDATVKRISSICKERNITYNELSNLSGLTPSTVYSLLNPKRKHIELSTVKYICDGLNISLGDFFSDDVFENLDDGM